MAKIIYALNTDDRTGPANERDTFARDIMAGLSSGRKSIPAAYHYDAEGSRLFKRITELPEYYLTRCEIDALERNREKIAALMRDDFVNLIEFGPGDGCKTGNLIRHFLDQRVKFRYVAMDISVTALKQLAEDYRLRFPGLPVDCLVADYYSNRRMLKEHYRERNLALFLGSSIGNLNPVQTRKFLHSLRRDLNDGDMIIIGFDLVKKAELIRKAYNDSQGVTAAFNFNLLERINRELGGNFEVSRFRYVGEYDPDDSVVRSYLISLADQEVCISRIERSFHFNAEEPIHTEDSYKYRESDIEELAAQNGFHVRDHLYDSKGYFIVSIWET